MQRECRDYGKSHVTGTGLLSSMQHYNRQILASAEGAKGQQRGGEPPVSSQTWVLAKEAVSILLLVQCSSLPADSSGVRGKGALLPCFSCPQLGYEPFTETFRGGVTSLPNVLGSSASLSISLFARPEQSLEGRGGLSTVTGVFQGAGKASGGGRFLVWCLLLADSSFWDFCEIRNFCLYDILVEKVTFVD